MALVKGKRVVERQSAGGDKEPSGIRTIHVAARILSALADYTEPVRVTDLARRLGMSMPTISRHLATWRTLGFVDKPDGQDTYRLSMKVLGLANAAIKQNAHASIAYPFLLELRDEVAETILFTTRVREHAVNVVSLDSGRATTVVVREGTRVSLPYSPSARLIWAFGEHSEEELDTVAAGFDYSADRSWSASVLKRKIRLAREEWWDFEIDLAGSHIGAIAAPVFDHNDIIIGTVAIIRPSRALQPNPEDALVVRLKKCAADISKALGSQIWANHPD